MHLKSQMNKENIASKFVFFSITHKSSLKVSFHEIRTHFFSSATFFNGFRRRSGKWTFGARPVKMNINISRCHFYFLFAIFLQVTHEFNASDWNHLTSSEQDLTSKIPCRVSRVTLLLGLYLLLLGMSSCWKKTCQSFWLKQDLRTQKEYQIRYGKVKVSFAVVFRLKTGIQSRQMRDEISCDRKYVL